MDGRHDGRIVVAGACGMTGYIQIWQCVGCGRIEAPQPCIGVCRDRKVFVVDKDEHERVLADNAALQEKLDAARAALLRFGRAKPRKGQWEASWQALQAQVREVLSRMSVAEATQARAAVVTPAPRDETGMRDRLA